MLSATRIVAIFRQRGGGEFANLYERLGAEQIAFFRRIVGSEPLIAVQSSEGEWFALTNSHLVFSCARELRRVPFDEICGVEISNRYLREVRNFAHIKTKGGYLDVELKDGAILQVKVEPGGPFLGLMNVLMRMASINRRRSAREASGKSGSPTTNDQRPTTQL